MEEAARAAGEFLRDTQFHLGMLVTEQSHPATESLSQQTQARTSEGVRTFLRVDQDIVPVARRTLDGDAHRRLRDEILRCLAERKKIFLYGCGASGRLAIILEAMWRDFWARIASTAPESLSDYAACSGLCHSFMTGGDRALIRSVEHFEDFQAFGRRQARDAGVSAGDVVVAIAEDGIPSSTIGVAKESFERGAKVFFTYNNHRDVLLEKMERSRDILQNPDIIDVDLTTGPMALTGSTRLQTTTIAMLFVGSAIESALVQFVGDKNPMVASRDRLGGDLAGYADTFEKLLESLGSEETIEGIARAVDIEAAAYQAGGRVTYTADTYLLDIFSDTTERTPTFMIPPFRQMNDNKGPVPWAFAKDPLRATPDAWRHLLRRDPRGTDWTSQDYANMQAPQPMIANPPAIGNDQILLFPIGNEPDSSRTDCSHSVMLWVHVAGEPEREIGTWFEQQSSHYTRTAVLAIDDAPGVDVSGEMIVLPLGIPETCCRLFTRIGLKMTFNILSTVTMARIGRIMGNWMVQVDATNKKLVDRATRLVAHFSGLSFEEAAKELHHTMFSPDTDRLEFAESYVIQTLRRLGKLPQ